AVVSFRDDLRGLPVTARLLIQILAVCGALAVLPADALVFQGLLPRLLDRVLTGLAWLWFVNLFNFMDGIDGLSGVEAAAIGFCDALVALFTGRLASVERGVAIGHA